MNKKGNALINVLALCIVIGLIITSFVLVTSPKFKIQDEITMDGTVIGGDGGSSNPDEPQQDIIKRLYIEVVDDDTSFNIENFSFYDKINSGSPAITNTKEYDFVVGHTYVFSAPGYLAKDISITLTDSSPLKIKLNKVGETKVIGLKEKNNVAFNVYRADSPSSNSLTENNSDADIHYYTLAVGTQYIITAPDYLPITIYIQQSSNDVINFTLKKKSDQTILKDYTILVQNTPSFIVRDDNTLEVINPKNGYYQLEPDKTYRIDSNIDFEYYVPYKFIASQVNTTPVSVILDKYFKINVTNIGKDSFSVYRGAVYGANEVKPDSKGRYKLTELTSYTIHDNVDTKFKDYVLDLKLNTDPKKPIEIALGFDYEVKAHAKGSETLIPIQSITDSNGKVISPNQNGFYTLAGETYTLNTGICFPKEFTIKEAVNGVINIELDNRYKITAKNSNAIIVYDTIQPTIPISPDNDGLYNLTENHSYIIKGNDHTPVDTTNKTITISIYPNTNHVIEVRLAEYYKINISNPIGIIVYDKNTDQIIENIDGQYELDSTHLYDIIPDIDPYDTKGYNYPILNLSPNDTAVNGEINLTFRRDYVLAASSDNHNTRPTVVKKISYSINNGNYVTINNNSTITNLLPGDEIKIKANDYSYQASGVEIGADRLLPKTLVLPNTASNVIKFNLTATYSIKFTNDMTGINIVVRDTNPGFLDDEIIKPSGGRYDLKKSKTYNIELNNSNGRFDTPIVLNPKNYNDSELIFTLPEYYRINVYDISTGVEQTLAITSIDGGTYDNNLNKWKLTPGDNIVYNVNIEGVNEPYKLKLTPTAADINNGNTINIYLGNNLSTINVTNGIPFKVFDSNGQIVPGNASKYLLVQNNTYRVSPGYNDGTHGYKDFTFNVTSSNPETYTITLPREYTIKTNEVIKELYINLAGKAQLLTPVEPKTYKQILKPGSYSFEAVPYNPLTTSVGDGIPDVIDLVFELDPYLNYKNITILPAPPEPFVPINSNKVYLDFIDKNQNITRNLLVSDTTINNLISNMSTAINEIKTDIPISDLPFLNRFFKNYHFDKSNVVMNNNKDIITIDFYKEIGTYKNTNYRIEITFTYDVKDNSTETTPRKTDIFDGITYQVKYKEMKPNGSYKVINESNVYNYQAFNTQIELLLQGYLEELQNNLSRYKVKVK